jgi:hypothetical protein
MEVNSHRQDAMQAKFDFYANDELVESNARSNAQPDSSPCIVSVTTSHSIAMTDSFIPPNNIDSVDESMTIDDAAGHTHEATYEARLWRDDGWTARVIKNEDDEGWAVEMCKDGESEPALVGPWTMGRDKKNPKPLDAAAFGTLVKTASEVLRRHEQQLHAMLHKSVSVSTRSASLTVTLDIIPDEDDPYALLAAQDEDGTQLAQVRVAANYKLSREAAAAWIENGFRKSG